MADLMNGFQVSEDCEPDIYSMLVPIEETEIQPDTNSKQGSVRFKYVLSTRDYFESD